MAVRASAENADRAALMGIPVRRVRTIVWMIAGLLSGVGVLQRTILIGNLPAGLTGATTLLYGLAPAVVARMQNIPVAIVSGLGIGIIDVGVFYSTRSATLSTALVLPLVVIALLMQRSKLSRSEDSGVESWKQVKEVRPIPDELINERSVIIGKWVVRALGVAVVLALPYLTGEGRTDLASVLIVYAIAGVSLVVLTGWAGQISLGQFAFVGVGAAVAGGLVANHGTDFITALFIAGLVGAALRGAHRLARRTSPGPVPCGDNARVRREHAVLLPPAQLLRMAAAEERPVRRAAGVVGQARPQK